MPRRTRLRRAACLTLLSAVPLIGCGRGGEAAPPPPLPTPAAAAPTPTPPPTSPPTPTPTPTSTTPVAEEPVAAPTPAVLSPLPFEGGLNETDATTFAAYYLQVLNYTRQTNDSSKLRAISAESCEMCRIVADVTDDFKERGMRYQTPDVQFERAFLDYYDADKGEADVRLQISGDLGVVVNADGSSQGNPNPFHHIEVMVYERFDGSSWKLVETP